MRKLLFLFLALITSASIEAQTKKLSSGQVLVAPCVNEDFESTASGAYTTGTAVTGWTVSSATIYNCAEPTYSSGSSEFSIVTTPVSGVPNIGTLPHSPLGGTQVARINDYVNNLHRTKLSTSFTVTPTNYLFQFAYASYMSTTANVCCEGPGFFTKMFTCGGTPISCGTMSLSPACGSTANYTTTSGSSWNSWTVMSVDLSPYMGMCIGFECWAQDNIYGGQTGWAYFDARCGSALQPNLTQVNNPIPVAFCPGSGIASLTAPPGYSSYSWTASSSLSPVGSSQATLSSITVTNPVAGGVYSVQGINPGTCSVVTVYTLVTSQISIFGLGSSPSCSVGSVGSATVQPSGSSTGYNFIWTNSSNSVIGTSSVVSNLAPGAYNVTVTAAGSSSSSCGQAATTITVQTGTPQPHFLNGYFCTGQSAYLSVPQGTNFQWYSGTTSVSSATTSAYTVTNAAISAIYRVGYNVQGCRDSIIYTLVTTTPGTVSATLSGSLCPGVAGGSAQVSYTPSAGAASNGGTVSVYSQPSFSPAYSFTGTLTQPAQSISVTSLIGGQSISVTVFDGVCFSGNSFTVPSIVPQFNLVPGFPTGTVCSGANSALFVQTTGQISGLTYSWSPSTFLSTQTASYVAITPTAAPGTQTTLTYSVIVTPTAANCPQTTTMAINVASPVSPQLTALPSVCPNATTVQLLATPAGGTFSPAPFAGGTINPSVLGPGSHTYSYSTNQGLCIAMASATLTIFTPPVISIAGNFSPCAGTPVTLMALGANSYTWNNQISGPQFTTSAVTPTAVLLKGSDANGCTGSVSVNLSPKPLPLIAVTGVFSVCAGLPTTLTASGAMTYTWNNNTQGPLWSQILAQTSTVSVTGTGSNNCSATQSVNVTVVPGPSLVVNGRTSICFGESNVLSASGASSYSWSTGSIQYSIQAVPPSTKVYTVTGTNSINGCKSSLTITVSISECTNLSENKSESDLRVFPNPTNGEITIATKRPAQVSVIDELGRIIFTDEVEPGTKTFDLKSFPNGVYLIRCERNGHNTTVRVVKE